MWWCPLCPHLPQHSSGSKNFIDLSLASAFARAAAFLSSTSIQVISHSSIL
jgi:hypothetical protein